ncbi:MAG: hypothetical protein ACK5QX_00715 [bacterium]|jgi:hypothetical protein
MESEDLPVIYNFKAIIRRNTFLGVSFALYDNNDVAFPIDGATAKMEVREKPGSPVILSFSTSDNTIIIESDGQQPVINQLRLAQRSATLMNIAGSYPLPKKYQYDLQITHPSFGTQTFFKGEFPVLEDITV